MTGGLLIFSVFFLASFISGARFNLVPFFLASSVIILGGLYDDLLGLSATQKLLVQFVASIILMSFGIMITRIKFPFGPALDIAHFSIPITIFWFLFTTNLINLLDGLDGLTAGLCAIVFLVIFIIIGPYLFSAQLAIFMGSLAAFLIYNFHPAKIFLGNNGSSFLGFAIGYFSLIASQKSSVLPILIMPVCILMVHVFDAGYSVLRRVKNGRKIFEGDKGHIHHILLGSIRNHGITVLAFYMIALLLAIVILRIYS